MILSYVRVSTLEQAADGATSLQEQERKNRALALMRGADSFDVIVYTDAGVSGSIPLKDRPAGAKMLVDAKPHDIIVASKLDRIFRSASDALVTVERLKADKIDLILIDLGTEPVTHNGTAKLFFQMLAAFAEFERERIAERMTDGRRCKKQRNGHTGGSAPYGYKIIGSGREAKLQPVEKEQLVIEDALSLHARDFTISKITQFFFRKGFRTRTGKKFKATQVRRMIERGLLDGKTGEASHEGADG